MLYFEFLLTILKWQPPKAIVLLFHVFRLSMTKQIVTHNLVGWQISRVPQKSYVVVILLYVNISSQRKNKYVPFVNSVFWNCQITVEKALLMKLFFVYYLRHLNLTYIRFFKKTSCISN